jgi:AAA domain/AAA domain, putative AbiEii toxin, Type IV TA system
MVTAMDQDDPGEASVDTLIGERLGGSGLPDAVASLVAAALLGEEELAAALSDGSFTRPPVPPDAAAAAAPGRTYLQSVVVQGFRGIGPQAALRLQPGPGLTVIAGRNGSGKSSFAEAAELALTGENKRWAGRTAVWRDGWRNLHAGQSVRIEVALAADGQPGVVKVAREWPTGAVLDDAAEFAQAPGGPRQPLAALGWSAPLQVYRPFLSYAELGALVGGRPSEMYDALQSILGLDQLLDAEQRLNTARKRLEERSGQAGQEVPGLLVRLREHADERARQAELALGGRRWDLAAVQALAAGGEPADNVLAERLRGIASLSLPPAVTVAHAGDRLTAAQRAIAGLAGTPAAEARRLAGLLTAALSHYADHQDAPCPVCGGRALDSRWAASAAVETERLTQVAAEADAAHMELAAASRALRGLVPVEPGILAADLGGEADARPARTAWQQWAALAAQDDPEQLAASAVASFPVLSAALENTQEQARTALRRRSEAWQPVAAALAAWVSHAQSSEAAATAVARLRKAITWLRAAGQEVRDARLQPFAAMSAQVWEMLRQESNVELGPIRLEGAATQRRVSLDVSVDGVPGAALSVMSQGELHALGLALFLPRATAPDSPFRFLVIDDPVQSMDPARVDGLARLLSLTAQDRQVIVFTHDDRLPEAVRRLQLPATVWEVTRREQSVVELKKNDDPVSRYLDDARALALTSAIGEEARGVVTAGFCRSALEAACQEAVRARRLAAGARHADVERVLTDAQTLGDFVALALFDDPARDDQVIPQLQRRYGPWAAGAFRAARAGTHAGYQGDLRSLVNDTRRLAGELRR